MGRLVKQKRDLLVVRRFAGLHGRLSSEQFRKVVLLPLTSTTLHPYITGYHQYMSKIVSFTFGVIPSVCQRYHLKPSTLCQH